MANFTFTRMAGKKGGEGEIMIMASLEAHHRGKFVILHAVLLSA
jgi:hypothetical protein